MFIQRAVDCGAYALTGVISSPETFGGMTSYRFAVWLLFNCYDLCRFWKHLRNPAHVHTKTDDDAKTTDDDAKTTDDDTNHTDDDAKTTNDDAKTTAHDNVNATVIDSGDNNEVVAFLPSHVIHDRVMHARRPSGWGYIGLDPQLIFVHIHQVFRIQYT